MMLDFCLASFACSVTTKQVAQFFHCERLTYRPGSKNPPSTARVWPVM
jgi:hypothetical protein